MDENKLKPLNGTNFDLLAETVGLRIATKLCKHFCREELFISNSRDGISAKRIKEALGETDAEVVLATCPIGVMIYIPRKPFSRKKLKQVTLFYVKKRVTEGATTKEIARELGITSRAVRNYRVEIGVNLPSGTNTRAKNNLQINSNAILTHHADKNRTNTPKSKKSAS